MDGELPQQTTHRRRNAVLLVLVVCVWVALDQATKTVLDGGYAPGDHIAGPFLGIFQFTLVHNTGMAWGLFDDSTLALGALSVVVCLIVAGYLLVFEPECGLLEAVGGSFVVAGGIGNAIDRFALGYVVDFIDPVFIEFPVFNVADMGVTCGFIAFLIGFALREYRLEKQEAQGGDEPGPGQDA